MTTSTSYTIRSAPESSLIVVTNTSVANSVGICYFDPVNETLNELSALSGVSLTVQPYKKMIKKYYLVVAPGATITSVVLAPSFINVPAGITPTNFYSLKTIISPTEPTLSNFDDLTNMNTFEIDTPAAGSFTPIWILLESVSPLNLVLNISLELTYN